MSQNFEPDKTNSVLCFKELTNFKISNLNMLAAVTIITYNMYGKGGANPSPGPRNKKLSGKYTVQ